MWTFVEDALSFVGTIKWYLVIGVSCLAAGFTSGYFKASGDCKAEQYKSQLEHLQTEYSASQKELTNLKAILETNQTIALNLKEVIKNEVSNDPVCTVGIDVTRLLNQLRGVPASR